MGITFNTNLSALTGQRYIGIASNNASSSLAKLSSGSRVPQAKDDAAGLSIGSKLKAEVAALTQDANNAGQAVSLLQIADGALSTVGDVLQRMKSLAVQSSSGQLADADRSLLNQEFQSLMEEIDRVAATANFNGTNLLSGSTVVDANINKISAVGTSVTLDGAVIGNAANKQISEGVDSISFASSVTTPAVKLEYDATHKTMTLTDLSTGATSAVVLSDDDIAVGKTEKVSFADIGATVVLNSNFDKTVSTSATNGVREITYTASNSNGTTVSTTGGLSSVDFRLKPNGTGGVSAANFNGASIAIAAGATGAGTIATVTVTVTGDDGASHAFSVKQANGSTGGTVDLSAAGAKTVTLVDSSGNEIDVNFTLASGMANNNAGAIALGVAGLNSSTSSVTAAQLEFAVVGDGVSVSTGVVDGVSLANVSFTGNNAPRLQNFGAVTFTGAGAAIVASSITVDGRVFSNTTGAQDFTGLTGDRTFSYSDGQGNTFDLVLDIGTTVLAATSTIDNIAAPTLATGAAAPVVQANSVKLQAVSQTSTSTFNFGDIDRAKVVFDLTSAASAGATLTLGDGSTFTATGVALNTTGTKTITLNGQGNNAGATLTISFNLTTAATDGQRLQVDVGELGQLIGADANTSGSTEFSFKVGTGTTVNDDISFDLGSATTDALGINGATIATAAGANAAITSVTAAITTVSSLRADVGAAQSRLGFAAASINVAIENTTAAQSSLLDVDVSAEITRFTSQQVLLQAGISLLAQANQQPSLLLRLLQ